MPSPVHDLHAHCISEAAVQRTQPDTVPPSTPNATARATCSVSQVTAPAVIPSTTHPIRTRPVTSWSSPAPPHWLLVSSTHGPSALLPQGLCSASSVSWEALPPVTCIVSSLTDWNLELNAASVRTSRTHDVSWPLRSALRSPRPRSGCTTPPQVSAWGAVDFTYIVSQLPLLPE